MLVGPLERVVDIAIVQANPKVIVAEEEVGHERILLRVVDACELTTERLTCPHGSAIRSPVKREEVAVVTVLIVSIGAYLWVCRYRVNLPGRVACLPEFLQARLAIQELVALTTERQPHIRALLRALDWEPTRAVGSRAAARLLTVQATCR